jgi:rifampicin phosphotransferase
VILTGHEILREHAAGRIVIDPFNVDQLNPNSYNFRLGGSLRTYRRMPIDPRQPNPVGVIDIGDGGHVLRPGRLYLAHTVERMGSDHYAPTYAARSSVARLGLFINLSASLGDIGFHGQWTLQLLAAQPLRIYPGMRIGQIMWWHPHGRIDLYHGKYQHSTGPCPSRAHLDYPPSPPTTDPSTVVA